MNAPTDINRETVLNRVLRENALAALMVVLTIIGLVNGVIIGLGIATMNQNTQAYEKLVRTYEINSVYLAGLQAQLRTMGIEPPPQPKESD